MTRKIILFSLILTLNIFTIFAQNQEIIYNDFKIGMTKDEFLSKYKNFSLQTLLFKDVINKGVEIYENWTSTGNYGIHTYVFFYKNKLYHFRYWFISISSNNINRILQSYVNKYGKPDNMEKSIVDIAYFWNINNNFYISARIQDHRIGLDIRHFDPVIENIIINME